MPHPKATLNLAGRYNQPSGRIPRDHAWDDTIGEWRHTVTGVVRAHNARQAQHAAHRRTTDAARARNAEQQQRSRTARVQRARHRRRNVARCNETLFTPGFDLSKLKPVDDEIGTLYDGASCELCGARLFKGEVLKSASQRGKKRGRACCSDGAVELPAVEKLARLDRLWRDVSDPKAKLLREHARKFRGGRRVALETRAGVCGPADGWSAPRAKLRLPATTDRTIAPQVSDVAVLLSSR